MKCIGCLGERSTVKRIPSQIGWTMSFLHDGAMDHYGKIVNKLLNKQLLDVSGFIASPMHYCLYVRTYEDTYLTNGKAE